MYNTSYLLLASLGRLDFRIDRVAHSARCTSHWYPFRVQCLEAAGLEREAARLSGP